MTFEDIKKMDNRTFTYCYLLALHRKLTREAKNEKTTKRNVSIQRKNK